MIAILGGGITGLTAAYELKKRNKEFILIEADSRLGGKIQSVQKDGYTFEYGPNTVLINNIEIKNLLLDLNLWDDLIFPDEKAVKSRFVLKNGELQPIPNSFKSAFKSRLFTIRTLLSILKEPWKNKVELEDESLASFARRRFGNQIYEDFITPFVTGIYAGDPERMSVNYVLSILRDAEQKKGSVIRGMIEIMKEKKLVNEQANLPSQKIFTFKSGLNMLISRIEDQIVSQVKLNSRVQRIQKNESGYTVSYSSDGSENQIEVKSIISCIPAFALSELVQSFSTGLSVKLSSINYVPATVVHLGYKKEDLTFRESAFGILSRKNEAVPFLGILFNSRFFPHSAPEGFELITVIAGGYKNADLLKNTDEVLLETITDSVKKLLGIKGNAEFTSLKRWEKGIPQYELGYKEIEAQIIKFQKEEPQFKIAGNYFNGISVSDCVKNGVNIGNSVN